MKRARISKLIAIVRSTPYELVPDGSGTCEKCCRAKTCNRKGGCPEFNDYTLASDLDVVYKKIESTPEHQDVKDARALVDAFQSGSLDYTKAMFDRLGNMLSTLLQRYDFDTSIDKVIPR